MLGDEATRVVVAHVVGLIPALVVGAWLVFVVDAPDVVVYGVAVVLALVVHVVARRVV